MRSFESLGLRNMSVISMCPYCRIFHKDRCDCITYFITFKERQQLLVHVYMYMYILFASESMKVTQKRLFY